MRVFMSRNISYAAKHSEFCKIIFLNAKIFVMKKNVLYVFSFVKYCEDLYDNVMDNLKDVFLWLD